MLAYVTTKDRILNYIKKNKVNIGEKLPPESELCKILGISRLTLREAINALKNEGMINSIQGKGTFVSGNIDNIANTLNSNLGISEMIVSSGHKPGVNHFEKELVKADKNIAKKIGVEEGADVLVLKRIRTADDKAVVYSMDYFVPKMTAQFLGVTDENVSIYSFMEDVCGIKIGSGIAEILPVVAEKWLAEMLEIEVGEPALMIKQVVTDIHGEPLLYAEEYLRSDSFKLLINRRRS
ncbi:MAG: GntR family transcriptional regulator [Clostridia bacterium]|jgi:GntR family transcriptional regulator|nr:GntR family transcriptional regulator [Clostridia bacterium]MBT7123135.1 GntR family transcriptional regulator [Clostridia bacterium]